MGIKLLNLVLGFCARPVSIVNGCIVVIRTLDSGLAARCSKNRASIIPFKANLVEQYGTRFGVPVMPAMDEMHTMWPLFKFVILGKNSINVQNCEKTLTEN